MAQADLNGLAGAGIPPEPSAGNPSLSQSMGDTLERQGESYSELMPNDPVARQDFENNVRGPLNRAYRQNQDSPVKQIADVIPGSQTQAAAPAQSAPDAGGPWEAYAQGPWSAYATQNQPQHYVGGVVPTTGIFGEGWDNYFESAPAGRILDAFGVGAKQGWGAQQFGLSPDAAEWMKKAGLFNDYTKGQNSIIKSFNEALIRPLAAAGDLIQRSVSAAGQGAATAGAQIAGELGAPQALQRDIGGIVESGGGLMGSPEALKVPSLPEARSLGVIGEGEAGYFGTKEPTPETAADRAQATKDVVAQQPEPANENAPVGAPNEPSPLQEPGVTDFGTVHPAQDIHTVARQVAPEVFNGPNGYDALSQQRDTFRRWIDELSETRDSNATQAIDAQIQDAQSRLQTEQENLTDATGKRAATYRNRVAAITDELNDLAKQRDKALADSRTSGDTPDMARVRSDLMATDYKMRDLAPQVSAAYRDAQGRVAPQEQAAPEVANVPEQTPASVQSVPEAGTENAEPVPEVREPVREPVEGEATAGTKEAPQGIPFMITRAMRADLGARGLSPEQIDQMTPAQAHEFLNRPAPESVNIADDVSKKLVAAGRPQEEADAAAALVSAHYDARAQRLGTTAGDLYQKEPLNVEAAAKGRKGELGRTVIQDGQRTIRLMANADASTFIHETGHSWLDELMSDAADERVIDQTKSDAQIVRTWLGNDGGEITRGQDEKFARGFERYMMEGRAPSQALASVFAKFKDWLTKIYQTVSRLRSPISDDIRAVFDRMLSANPEKPVIAEETEAPKQIGEKHTEMAENTADSEAEIVRQAIRAEADDYARMNVPEIADELGIGRRPDITGNPPEGGGPNGNGPAGQSEPAATGGGAPTGTVGAGGGEVAPESARGDTAVLERPTPRTESPTEPNQRFGPTETKLIDKAGNIRLDNLNQPEDVNAVIREAAERNGDFINARRGVISDAQVLDLADALGMDADTLNRRKIGQAFNAEEIVAARKLLIQSATNVRDLAAKAAEGSDADVMAYAQAADRHRMIQENVAGITAEAGRALRAFRELEGGKEAQALGQILQETTGRTLFQLRREAKAAAALDTPAQVSKFERDAAKPTFGDMILEYWINGLISGLATHTTYSIGNTLLALNKAGPETAVAALSNRVFTALGKDRSNITVGEVPAQLFGMLKGFRNGAIAAWESVKSGQTTLLPGEREGMSAREFANSPMVNPKKAIPDFTVGGIPVPVGTLARLPSRGIAAIHSFFRTMNYEREMAALAYRTAMSEGLGGDAFSARVGQIIQNPDADLMQQARSSATDLTLMGRGGELTQALSRLTNARFAGGQWLKFIDPFVHISSNVLEQAILQRSPVGIFSSQIRDSLMGKDGPVERDMAVARMVTGTALSVAVGSLAAEGLVSGSGPSDPKQAAMWRLAGNQPHSVKVGDTWYDIHRLGPLGMQVGIAADLYDVAHSIGKEDATKVAELLSHSLTQNILDESFMRGPADLIRSLSDPDRYGQSYIRDFLSSFTPYSVGTAQIARAVDPYSRQARSLMDEIKAKIPGLSESLFPRRDIWGEPLPSREALGMAGLSAIYEQKVGHDPVNLELLRLGVAPSQPERKIRGVQLDDQQYDDFSRIAGRFAKLRLNEAIQMPGWNTMPDAVKIKLIDSIISGSREMARGQVMMHSAGTNNDIMQKAIDNKKALAGQGAGQSK